MRGVVFALVVVCKFCYDDDDTMTFMHAVVYRHGALSEQFSSLLPSQALPHPPQSLGPSELLLPPGERTMCTRRVLTNTQRL